jgi:hypothetical protein
MSPEPEAAGGGGGGGGGGGRGLVSPSDRRINQSALSKGQMGNMLSRCDSFNAFGLAALCQHIQLPYLRGAHQKTPKVGHISSIGYCNDTLALHTALCALNTIMCLASSGS